MMEHITFISAGAGSGKTYRLACDLEKHLTGNASAKPAGIIGTTFTKLAAGELRERVRLRLNERGFTVIANQMDQALFGTVNSVCGQLLERFAFEAGLSPKLKVIEEAEANQLFSQALEQVLTIDTVQRMNALAYRLSQDDWKANILSIVNTARANNLDANTIRQAGIDSSASLLELFPEPTTRNLDAALHQAVEEGITFIETAITNKQDKTKGTKEYLDLLQSLVATIREQRLQWANWPKLAKKQASKASLPASDAVNRAAGDYEMHPRLQSDIREYTEQLFAIAATALDRYQQDKAKRGLIDFTDQEQQLYLALDLASVQKQLREEIDLLMVDEFQDTSPIQLALFLRLAALAKRVIWVGDVKQAIYGFRGSDPELMQAILNHLQQHGGATEILDTSWRSRPELVEYVNEIFVPAFADLLPKERVALKPRHDCPYQNHTAVAYWQLQGSNKEKRALAVALGVQNLIQNGQSVIDKHNNDCRSAHYGDIAILCRTHDNLTEVATALQAFGIPISRSQAGLLKSPEAALVLAAVRFLTDRSDSLATAELIALSQGIATETWLEQRLHHVNGLIADSESTWGAHYSIVQALTASRERVPYLTPAEVVAEAIQSGKLRDVVLQWQTDAERAKQRWFNIDQLLSLALDYQDRCGNEGRVATVTGLLLWLNQLKQDGEDIQASGGQEQAVKLLTHHGAKGLEWPIVIALDLDSGIKTNLWGLSVVGDQSTLDITQPLHGRQLQYWLWPFGGQSSGIPIKDKAEQSARGIAAQKQAFEEAKRLLYVSLTRPRDCLILAMIDANGEWLKSLSADWMLPTDSENPTLTLPDSQKPVPALFQLLSQEESPATVISGNHPPHAILKPTHYLNKLKSHLSPSDIEAIAEAKVIEIVELGERIRLKGTPEMAHFGEAIHALIATNLINNPNEPVNLAEQVLTSYQITEYIETAEAILCIQRFRQFIQRFKPTAIHVEYPIAYQNSQGQSVNGWIDVLLETESGYVIIDHKSNPQTSAEWEGNALKYSGQLQTYMDAVEAATGKMVEGCWIHFPISGGCVSVVN